MISAKTQGGEPELGLLQPRVNGGLLCTCKKAGKSSVQPRELRGSASVIGDTGRRSATSAQPRNPREPGLRKVVGDYRSGEREHCVFYLIFLNDYCRRARLRKNDR